MVEIDTPPTPRGTQGRVEMFKETVSKVFSVLGGCVWDKCLTRMLSNWTLRHKPSVFRKLGQATFPEAVLCPQAS